ncbi:MAG: insulinase family protein [Patescibacteria group bacterium]|nr:insulinase family protein [Patescibacteria group bacterium]
MKFNKTTLSSGLRLVTIPMPDNPSVTVLVMVEAGSKYETKAESGMSHFLEHMVFKGTPKRPKASDISRELDSIGAQYNAFTAQEFTGYYAKADARHLDIILDVISDLYQNPLFDEKEMEKEKGVIVEEIKMYRDLPQKHVQDVLMELVYGDQPSGWNIAGTEENVRSFSRAALSDYRSRHYVAPATVVFVAGSFDEQAIAVKVRAAFNGLDDGSKAGKPSVSEAQDRPAIRIEAKETDQTHLVFGFRSFPIKDPRMPAMQVLSGVLGAGMSSRLFSKMRDELGICYYIRAANDPFTDHGLFTISAGVDNARVGEAIREILQECIRLKTELVPEAELRKVKDYLAGTTMLELETSEARAEFAGYQEILKGSIEMPDAVISKIKTVTAAEVTALAKDLFKEERLNLAMVGRAKTADIEGLLRLS